MTLEDTLYPNDSYVKSSLAPGHYSSHRDQPIMHIYTGKIFT